MTAPKGAGPEAAATDLEAQKNVGNENARSSKPQPQNPQAAPKSCRDVLPIHPASDLLPRMSADEVRALQKTGPKSPIVLWSPGYSGDSVKDRPRFVLHGINELDAMELVGIQFLTNQGALLASPQRISSIQWREDHGSTIIRLRARP
jgi:hypothetical protein